MKYLIVVSILAIFAALIYLRLRPYLLTARRVIGAVRGMSGGIQDRDRIAPPSGRASEPSRTLIRCDSCGTWIPSARAVKPGRSAPAYCSHACLERAASVDENRKAVGRK